MSTTQIEPERIRSLNDDDPHPDGRYVLHWMQSSQRAEHNPALELAIQRANDHDVALVVAAVVIADYPEASARHFAFMLGGLGQALRAVERRGATVVVRSGDPVESIVGLCDDAVEVVCDRGYLRHQKRWRRELAERAGRAVTEVEGDVVVPVDVVSDHREHAARTIRPKIAEHRDRFLVDLGTTSLDRTDAVDGPSADIHLDAFDDVEALLADLGLDGDGDGQPRPVDWITPGTAGAHARLDDFLDAVGDYDDRRNRYTDEEGISFMSPYLHFGQISPVAIALEVLDRAGERAEPYLEELIVRRELAKNYVEHCADYDSWAGLPEWARDSLEAHRDDERDDVYTAGELERGETDDEVWNAIMHEIRERGWVHNQLRMYWGKQFVRWTNTPRHAHRTLLEINNRWFLDGRDESSFANVGWCFGLHDQGFQERDVSGKLRPFTRAALNRKGDLGAWVDEHGPDGDPG
ncbi:deoxyribodipyrimidine photo-lyase [Ilumatobacter sp.]|uniref:deoxyribodipyrimidine photo-lyase n=1 Tax=Ilumatobacter sp. TaxID=1967498 RepID=UPI003B529AA2